MERVALRPPGEPTSRVADRLTRGDPGRSSRPLEIMGGGPRESLLGRWRTIAGPSALAFARPPIRRRAMVGGRLLCRCVPQRIMILMVAARWVASPAQRLVDRDNRRCSHSTGRRGECHMARYSYYSELYYRQQRASLLDGASIAFGLGSFGALFCLSDARVFGDALRTRAGDGGFDRC